jgi:hypothetical protein
MAKKSFISPNGSLNSPNKNLISPNKHLNRAKLSPDRARERLRRAKKGLYGLEEAKTGALERLIPGKFIAWGGELYRKIKH